MKNYIQKHLAFHKSNELNCLISKVNWDNEKLRIHKHLEALIHDHNLESDFYVYSSFNGYHKKGVIEQSHDHYIQVEKTLYGHETIGIMQYRKTPAYMKK